MKSFTSSNQDLFKDALINSISDSIIATDLHGKIIYWNKAAEEIYKWKSKEVIGKSILEITPSTTTQKQAEEIMNSLKHGDSWEGEFEVRDKNGKIFPVHVKDSPLLDSTGNLLGIIGISRDISGFKEAENKLKETKEDAEESKKKFETIFNMSQSLICIADINTLTFQFINPTFERILGYSEEELLSKPFTEFIHPDDIKRTNDVVEKQLKAGIAVQTFENRYLCKDGNYCWLSWNSFPIPEKGITYAIAHDITERKEAEHALKESEERLRLVINESPFPITIADTNDERIKYWSNSAKKLVGYTPNFVSDWYELAYPDPEYRQKVIEKWKPFLTKAQATQKAINTGEYQISCKDGSMKTCELYAQFIPNNLVVTINDITDRKKVENALKQQNQYLEKLNNSLESVVFTVDIENRKIEYVNNRVKAVFGYNPDECIGRTTRFLYPNKDAFINYGKQMQKAFQNNLEFLRIENFLKRKNGQLFNTDITTSFISKTKVVAVITDITEQKKAEKELRNSEENLKSIVENSTNIFYKHDVNHNLTYLSPQIKDVMGYELEEAKILWTEFATDNPINEIGFKNTVKAIETGERQDVYDLEVMHKDGHKLWVEVRETPIVENGKTTEIVGAIVDVTDKRKSKQELITAKEKAEKSEANVKAIIEGAQNSIWAFDKDYRIIYINRILQQDFLHSFGVLLKPRMSLIESLPEQLHPLWKPRYDRALANEQFTIEDAVETNAGTLYIEVTFNPIIKNNEVIGGSCIGSDITVRKNAEKELLQAKQNAEESDRLKSAFLANMSHEIRTPMNGILGFTNLLQEPDLTGEQQQQYIEIIKKSGSRMLATVNDIIEISKIETGQIKVSTTKVNITKHLKTLCEFFSLEAEKKGLKLVFENELSEDESLIVSDKNKLSSILTNLIKNALKFTEKGTIKIGCKKNKKFLELYIEDSGIGIPANRKDAIFNRFEQADIEDKQVHEGSGLGLAISKSYIEMLGGKIWVESEENKGSTFFFTTPYNPAKTEIITKSSGEKQAESKVKKLKILIVEDDYASSLFLSTILKHKADNIQIVSDGLKAVEVCKNNSHFNLILMDVKLPGIDGLEATERIRKFNKDVKIIAQTAHALEGDKEKAIEAGCDDYISKPIEKEKLYKLLGKVFS